MTFFKQFRAAPGTLLKGDPMKKKAKVEKKAEPGKDKDHLEFISKLPCVITGKRPVDVCHVSAASKQWGKPQKGIGAKAHDKWTVPMQHHIHMQQHAHPKGELGFWREHGIDPFVLAYRLYHEADGDVAKGEAIIREVRSTMKGAKV